MDSEDAMQRALDEAAEKKTRDIDPQQWLRAENRRRSLWNQGPIDENSTEFLARFPARNSTDDEQAEQAELDIVIEEPKSFEESTWQMVAHLLNRLESMGANLLADYNDSGETELSGVNHSVRFDLDSCQWEVIAGRGPDE